MRSMFGYFHEQLYVSKQQRGHKSPSFVMNKNMTIDLHKVTVDLVFESMGLKGVRDISPIRDDKLPLLVLLPPLLPPRWNFIRIGDYKTPWRRCILKMRQMFAR